MHSLNVNGEQIDEQMWPSHDDFSQGVLRPNQTLKQ